MGLLAFAPALAYDRLSFNSGMCVLQSSNAAASHQGLGLMQAILCRNPFFLTGPLVL